MNRFSFLFIIICVLLYGCDEEEVTPIITVKTAESELNELLSDPKGGVATLEFSINVPWSITIDYSNTSIGMVKDWLIISKTSGDAGDITINLQVIENFEYDERSATINIKTASIVKRIKITQNQRLGMILSKTSVVIEYYEQVLTIDVDHNVDYNFEIQSDWITHIETKLLDKKTESFSIPENTIREKRFSRIVFMSKDKVFCDTVQVVQNPKPQRLFYIDMLCNGIWQYTEQRIKGIYNNPDVWSYYNPVPKYGWFNEYFLFTTDETYNSLLYYHFDSIFFLGEPPQKYNIGTRNDSCFMRFDELGKRTMWIEIQQLTEDSLVLYDPKHFWIWASTGSGGGSGEFPTIWKYEHHDKTEYIWENDTTSVFYEMLTIKDGWRLDSLFVAGHPYKDFNRVINYSQQNLYFTKDSMIEESENNTLYSRWYLLGNRIKVAGDYRIYKIHDISDSTLIIDRRPNDEQLFQLYANKLYYSKK